MRLCRAALRKGFAFPWSFYISKHPQGKNPIPRPLGGEGGPQPALSPAGAGRVRGSKPKPAQPNASRSDHPMAATLSTNSSGTSSTMPFETHSTVYPRSFRCASRCASLRAWLGYPCTLPSSSTISRRSGQQKSARYGPTGCWRRNRNPWGRNLRSKCHAARSASVDE